MHTLCPEALQFPDQIRNPHCDFPGVCQVLKEHGSCVFKDAQGFIRCRLRADRVLCTELITRANSRHPLLEPIINREITERLIRLAQISEEVLIG